MLGRTSGGSTSIQGFRLLTLRRRFNTIRFLNPLLDPVSSMAKSSYLKIARAVPSAATTTYLRGNKIDFVTVKL